ncbi:MAG: hypothetical protein ACE5OZ_12950 [Candidatus Heimdallarchaeota archaeon]
MVFGLVLFRFDERLGGTPIFNEIRNGGSGLDEDTMRKISAKVFLTLAMSEEESQGDGWAVVPLPLETRGFSYSFWSTDSAGARIIHVILLLIPKDFAAVFIINGNEILNRLKELAISFMQTDMKVDKDGMKTMLTTLQESCERLPKEPEADKAAHIKVESGLGPLREQADTVFVLPGKGQLPAIVLHPSFRSPSTVEVLKKIDGKKTIKDILVEIQSEGSDVPIKEVMSFLVQFEHKGYIIRV